MGVTEAVNADSRQCHHLRFGVTTSKLVAMTDITAEHLSVAQLAEVLGVSVRTALRRVQDGEIPATKLPGRTGAYVIARRDIPR